MRSKFGEMEDRKLYGHLQISVIQMVAVVNLKILEYELK